MHPGSYATLFAGGLFLGMLCLLELGRRLGQRQLDIDPKGTKQGSSVVNTSIFGLLGLLVAFTFSGAASRFDDRRQMTVEEANDISTAWMRLDVLPVEPAEGLRESFRKYLDSRILTYEKFPDIAAAEKEVRRTGELQIELWEKAVAACRESESTPPYTLLLPALNQMFDTGTTRIRAPRLHPPMIIFGMLGFFSLTGALLAGYNMAGGRSRNWVYMLSFSLVLSITIFVIIDIEYPRLGLIRVDKANNILTELRTSLD